MLSKDYYTHAQCTQSNNHRLVPLILLQINEGNQWLTVNYMNLLDRIVLKVKVFSNWPYEKAVSHLLVSCLTRGIIVEFH